MKKVLLFATAGILMAGAAFAGNNCDKGKKKKCAKGKSCCSQKKACCKKKEANSVPM